MALIIGASLSVSGTMFQAILKNPLADPYIIGVSAGAALGATIATVLSLNYTFILVFAFMGSIFTVTFVYLIFKGLKLSSTSLILSGIAVSFILTSSVLLIFSMSKSEDVHKAIMWLMGDLSIGRYNMLPQMGLLSIAVIIVSSIFHKHLDIISFGESFSKNSGISVNNIRNIFWLASLLSAISVSLSGVIGFVGLIMPHIIRSTFGPDHLKLIPLAAMGGGLFLLISDTIGRSIAPPFEIPVGIITGFLGGIFFLIYMIKQKNI